MVRKIPGRFSSSADQQERPFVQVGAHRSIWIKWQRLQLLLGVLLLTISLGGLALLLMLFA
jgi:hypothetical protein